MHPARIRSSAVPVALVLGLVSLAVVADTFIVPVDFPTIQEAIDVASDGVVSFNLGMIGIEVYAYR